MIDLRGKNYKLLGRHIYVVDTGAVYTAAGKHLGNVKLTKDASVSEGGLLDALKKANKEVK